MNEDEVKKLYNALLSKGYSTDNIGDEETFIGKMGDKGNRKELYDWISSNNDFRIGDYEQYERRLAGNLQNAPTPPKQAVVSVPTQELPTGTAYGHDANGNEVSVRDDMDNALPTLPDGVQADANDKVQFADASHYKELADKIGNADYSINPAKKTTFADHVAKAADNMYMSRTANEHATRKQMESLSNDVERQYNEAYDKSFEKNKGMAASEQFITLVESDKDVSMLKSARHSLENARKMVAEADKAVKENNLEGAVFGTARGFGDKFFDVRTWDMGLGDLGDNMNLNSALKVADSGERELTPAERALLDAKAVEMATQAYFSSYIGRGYKAGGVTAESLPFMLEMMVNPASAAGKSAQSMLMRYALKRFGRQAVVGRGGLMRLAGAATRGLGDLLGSAGMSATSGAIDMAADAFNRMNGQVMFDGSMKYASHNGGEKAGTAIAKAFAARTIENHSEMLGEYFAPFLKGAGKLAAKGMDGIGLNSVNRFIDDVASTDFAKALGEFEKRAKWNGNISEFAEEIAGGVENALFVHDQTLDKDKDTGVFNTDNMIDTLLGVSLMGGAISTAKSFAYVHDKYKLHKDMSMKNAAAESAFGDKTKWQNMANAIQNGTDEELKSLLSGIVSSPDYSHEQKLTALNFAKSVMAYKGSARMSEKMQMENAGTLQNDVQTSYDNGYTLEERQDMNDAKNMMEAKRAELGVLLGVNDGEQVDDMIDSMSDDPTKVVDALRQRYGLDDEQAQTAIDYLNAKATYDGMIDHVRDDVDERTDAVERSIRANVFSGGDFIVGATMKVDDRKVYVMSGKVLMTDDGTLVDTANSDGTIIVKDAQSGKLEMVSPKDILGIDAPVSVDELVEQSRATIEEQVSTEATNKIDGVLPFNAKDTYIMVDSDGARHTINVTPEQADSEGNVLPQGMVNVLVDGQPAIMPMADVQDGYWKYNQQRLDEHEQQKRKTEAQIAKAENSSSEENNGIIGRSMTTDEASALVSEMESGADVAQDIELTPENWVAQFGESGEVNTPIGTVKMGENQYFKLARQGRSGKLGMVKPTLEHPSVIIEDFRPSNDGTQERPTSYVFIKTFAKGDGSRFYHFMSVSVLKDGKEVVISNEERSVNRISKLLQQSKVTWIDQKFSLHPKTQIEESVPVNDSSRPTSTDNQPALLGINSSELNSSAVKGTKNAGESQEKNDAVSATSALDVISAEMTEEKRMGKRMSKEASSAILTLMERFAEPAAIMELTPENWVAQFGESGEVNTPIGIVKMGDNQLSKLFLKKRDGEFGYIKPTLTKPDIILEKNAPAEGAERDTKYLFIKSFVKPDGSRIVYYESVTVSKGGMEVSISSHEVDGSVVKKEMQNGIVLHLNDKLSNSSDLYLTETQKERPDLVPASDNDVSSAVKGTKNAGESQEKNDAVSATMPMTKSGEPDYSKATPGQTHHFFYTESGFTRAVANKFVDNNLSEAKKTLDSLAKKEPKPGTSISKYKNEMAKWEKAKQNAQQMLDYWTQVARLQKAVIEAERAQQKEKDSLLHDKAVAEEERRKKIESHLGEKYSFSTEEAKNGEVFYQNENGETTLATISEDIFDKIGMTPVPFKLTETMAWHVFEHHAKELKLKNIDDAIDFVLSIINNADTVRLGRGGSYIFSIENGRKKVGQRAVAIIVDSKTGDFMGIRTAGYESIKNIKERPLLWTRGADAASEEVATPPVSTIASQQGDKNASSTEGQNEVSSADKGTGNKPNGKWKGEKSADSEAKTAENDGETTEGEPKSDAKQNDAGASADVSKMENDFRNMLKRSREIEEKVREILGGDNQSAYDKATAEQKAQVDALLAEYKSVKTSMPLEDLRTLNKYVSRKMAEAMVAADKFYEQHPDERLPKKMGAELDKWANLDTELNKYRSAVYGDKRLFVTQTSEVREKEANRAEKPQRKIDDYGEQIAGARKDALKDLAKGVENVTEQSLIANTLSKVWKKPNLEKLVEKGVLTDEEAKFVDALMSVVDNWRKPKAAKGYKAKVQEEKIVSWAKHTRNALDVIQMMFETDAEGRKAIMESASKLTFPMMENEKAEAEQVRAMNQDRGDWKPSAAFGTCFTPNEVYVAMEMHKRLGKSLGDKMHTAFRLIAKPYSHDGYRLQFADGEKFFYHSFASIDDAMDYWATQEKLLSGDSDVEISPREIGVTTGRREYVNNGRWEVKYMSKGRRSSFDIKTFEYDTKEEADKKCAELNAKEGYDVLEPRPQKEWKTVSYKVYTNLVNGDRIESSLEFETSADAHAAIEQDYERVNSDLVEQNQKALEAKGEKQAKSRFELMSMWNVPNKKTIWLYGQKVNMAFSNFRRLSPEFDSKQEAEAWFKEHEADLNALIDKIEEAKKNFVFFKPDDNGAQKADHRSGKNMTEKDLGDAFGFRGIQFGNWTNDRDRQEAVNQAYDSLMDMAAEIGISPKAVSLGGQLGLAFGSRGSGSANAHYEPSNVVINLTKTRGAGSLAHEWWHALDNYFARAAGMPVDLLTSNATVRKQAVESGMLRGEIADLYGKLVEAVEKSSYGKRQAERSAYWKDPVEMTARLFDAWITKRMRDKDAQNGFLSHAYSEEKINQWKGMMYNAAEGMARLAGKEMSMSKEEFFKTEDALRGYPNPTAEEIEELGGAMQKIFDTMQERVDEKGAAVLYEIENSDVPAFEQSQREAAELAVDLVRGSGIEVIMDEKEMAEALGEGAQMQAKLSDLAKAAMTIRGWRERKSHNKSFVIDLPTYTKRLIKNVMGRDFDSHLITSDGIQHAINNHGVRGKHLNENSIPIREEDLELIPYIMTAPDYVKKGSTKNSRESVRFYKRLENGYVVVIEKEWDNSADDMETINMWAELSDVPNAKQTLGRTSETPTIGRSDAAKIRKDAENAIVRDGILQQLTVFHGSGADFDAFDYSHMGEGEGAQAYGWGTYVTEVDGIARHYASLNDGVVANSMDRIRKFEEFISKTLKELEDPNLSQEERKFKEGYIEVASIQIKQNEELIEKYKNSSRILYTVNIPENTGENYLKWNAPVDDSLIDTLVNRVRNLGIFNDEEWKTFTHEMDILRNGDNRYKIGKYLYQTLGHLMGGDQKASELFSQAGFVGIEYPAEYRSGGREDGAKNYVIFNEADAKITDKTQFLRTRKGEVYGFVKDGKIYLDPTLLNPNTPIHEYTHIWDMALQKANPELWKRGVELMKKTPLWDEMKKNPAYADIAENNDLLASEVHARLAGKEGAALLQKMTNDAKANSNGVLDMAEKVSAIAKLRQWMKEAWQWVRDTMTPWTKKEAQSVSLEDFVNMPLKDLVEGKKIDTKNPSKENTQPQGTHSSQSMDDAKVQRDVDRRKQSGVKLREIAEKYRGTVSDRGVLTDLGKALGAKRMNDGASQYATFSMPNGNTISIRVSNHNANAKTYKEHGVDGADNTSIVIKERRRKNTFKADEDVSLREYVYMRDDIANDGSMLSKIATSLADMLESGVYEDTTGKVRVNESPRSVIQYRFIGENGAVNAEHAEEATTRMDNLSVARDMEKDDKDAKAIKMATGWERGADGKWRYEVADFKLAVNGDGRLDEVMAKEPWGREYKELENKLFKGDELTLEQTLRFDELQEKVEQVRKGLTYPLRTKTLEDYVRDETLFKEYPQLRNMPVRFGKLEDEALGAYNPIDNSITIDNKVIRNARKRIADLEMKLYRAKYPSDNQRKTATAFGLGGQEYWDGLVKELEGKLQAEKMDFGLVEEVFKNDVKSVLAHEVQHAIQEIEGFARGSNLKMANNNKAKYRATAGEVEARNVQTRMYMTDEQRRNSLASETEDVSRKDQIFLFGGAERNNMGSRVDKRMAEHAEDMDARTEFSKELEGESIDDVNTRFNEELDAYKNNQHRGLLHLGSPMAILRTCGIDQDLTLSPSVLHKKLRQHSLTTDNLKGLASAIQHPILVYKHGENHPNIVVVTNLEANGGKVAVAVELDEEGKVVEINNISSVHNKEAAKEIERLGELPEDKLRDGLRWVEKEKVSDWFGIADLNSPIHTSNPKLVLVAKVIKDFENPIIDSQDLTDSEELFRILDEEEDGNLIETLENGEQIETYRAMAVDPADYEKWKNGEIADEDLLLYPPMAFYAERPKGRGKKRTEGVKRDGVRYGQWFEADENIDKAYQDKNGNWVFDLIKDNGDKVPAAYNPYVHSSDSPLNDQFSTAYKRPNIIVVRTRIPASEMTSGYKAERAKDSVGMVPWKSGIVGGKLSEKNQRHVYLSRWAKPVEILSDEETAKLIAERLEGEGVIVPSNTVTPSLRKALEKEGVPVVESLDKNGKVIKNDELPKVDWSKYPRFAKLEEIGKQFKKDLQHQIDGTLEEGHIYQLGMPNAYMLATGFPRTPIEMSATMLRKHSEDKSHPFKLSEIKNLIESMQHPLAIFKYGDETKSQNVIVEIEQNGKNFLVGIHFNQGRRGLVVSDIRGIFPKNNWEWLHWIEQDKLKYVDKEKIQELIDKQRKTLAEVDYLDLDSVSKIVEYFENPVITDINSSVERSGNGPVSDASVSYENDPMQKLGMKRTERQKKAFAAEERRRMRERANGLAKKLGVDVDVRENADGLTGRKAKAKGWFEPKSGKIVVILGNHTSAFDVEQTMLHEAVAHYGLRKLFGKQFDQFLDNVYRHAEKPVREKIAALAAKRGWDFRTATEEYLASLAENTAFENMNSSWWGKIKQLFMEMLHTIGFEYTGPSLSDNELRYILWRSYENLREPGAHRSILGQAEDIAMQNTLGVGNYAKGVQHSANAADSVGERQLTDIKDVNSKFNELLDGFNEDIADKIVFDLGWPSDVLLSAGVSDMPMKLYGSKVIKKMKKHGFALDELRDLPKAVANPIAVFKNYGKEGNRSILTELRTDNGNFLVTLSVGKGNDIDFNIVSSVFGKGSDNIVDWIEKGFATYINKEKALNYLHHSVLKTEALSNSRLSYAAKLVKEFDNTKTANSEFYADSAGESRDKYLSKRAKERAETNHRIDAATAFVSGKTEKEARRERLEREQERRDRARKMYDNVLRGQFDDVTLQQINDYIDEFTPRNPFGRHISERLPQEVERRLYGFNRANAVDALFSRISESAVEKTGGTVESRRRAGKERKKALLEGWAKATGNWHTSIADFTDHTEPIGSGKDSVVYNSNDGKHVIKVSKGKDDGRKFESDIDAVALYNGVFQSTAYNILGYGNIDGQFVKFLEQPRITFSENAYVNKEERVEFMKSLGFEPSTKAETAFSNGKIVVADVQKGNIVRDDNGIIHVIDADVRLHTKDIGGNYTYPDASVDIEDRRQGNERGESAADSVGESRMDKLFTEDANAFANKQRSVVEHNGIVTPNLNNSVAEVVDVPRHDFTGKPIEKARAWAKENLTGEHTMRSGDTYTISNGAVDKYLSHSSNANSDNLGVHLSVLKMLPTVIDNSIDAEIHPDYKKGTDGIRRAENGVNRKDMLVHRLYGAIKIDGVTYLVKTTMHEYAPGHSEANAPHSYEVTKIEVFVSASTSTGARGPISANSGGLTIETAKLLNGVEKSYDTGKKLLDESENDNSTGILFRTTSDDVVDIQRGLRGEYDNALRQGGYQMQEAFQDSMLGLKKFMEIVAKATGNTDIADWENPYMAENARSSRNQAEQHEYRRKFYEPIVDALRKLQEEGMTADNVGDYLMLKHGIERNREMAVREAISEYNKKTKRKEIDKQKLEDWNKRKGDVRADANFPTWQDKQREMDRIAEHEFGVDLYARDYSGMTSILSVDDVEQAVNEAYDEVQDSMDSHSMGLIDTAVMKATKATLEKMRTSGMISKYTADGISRMYDYYVPLRGFDEQTADETYAYIESEGSAFSSPIKTAHGRSSKADSPLAYIMSMADSAIAQGNKNLDKQKLLNFVLNRPSDLATVNDLWIAKNANGEWETIMPTIKFDATPEEVEAAMQQFEEDNQQRVDNGDDGIMKLKDRGNGIPYRVVQDKEKHQHQVIVKRAGRSYVITINGNPRAAMAINGQTNPNSDYTGSLGSVKKGAEYIMRTMSAFFTTKNPDFVASNFIRDLLYTNSMVHVKESPEYAFQFNKNFVRYNPGRIGKLFHRYDNGLLDMGNPVEKEFYNFMINGGETGYSSLKEIDDLKKELEKDVHNSRTHALKKYMDRLEIVNRAIENGARFAAYMTSRQSGRSIQRSVWDAKEISVNFNKKGAGSTLLGKNGQTTAGNAAAFSSGLMRCLYVFFNASVQGTANLLKAAGGNKKKAMAMAASYFVLGLLASAIGGGDDDDEFVADDDTQTTGYYNLSPFIRRTNIIIPALGGSFISLPLPVEFRTLYGMGELAQSVLSGNERYSAAELAKEMVGLFTQALPVDFMEGTNALVPSVAAPIVDVVANKDFTGKPIYRDNAFNQSAPEWTKAYKRTNSALVGASKWLNEATGGDDATSGAIDLNPAVVESLAQGYFGGAVSTLNKLYNTYDIIAGDKEFDWRNIPVANRLVRLGNSQTKIAAVNREYFNNLERAEELQRRAREYKKIAAASRGDMQEKYLDKLKELLGSEAYTNAEAFRRISNQISKMNSALKQTGDNADLSNSILMLKNMANEVMEGKSKEMENAAVE